MAGMYTWIVDNRPVANRDDERVHGRNRVQYPVGLVEDVLLHLALHACGSVLSQQN